MLETTQPPIETASSNMNTVPMRVLLVDDNEDDALIAEAMLTRVRGRTFDVQWVSTFRQGLERLKEDTHDICLLDYCLGKETGLDVLGEALRFGCRVPIIMLTGTTDPEIDMQAIKLGAADYVVKGETNPGLLERVIRHAQERRKAAIERERLTHELLESSRRLGMAEVATDVLHNVGNVLNSLNVSAGLIAQHVRDMPIQDVKRISSLLEHHKEDLGSFLTQDAKGQKIPAFLLQLGDHLRDQHAQTCQDLDSLIGQIDHVNDIITAQQDLTQTNAIHEPMILKDLIESALDMNAQELERQHITITRDYADLPQVITDKQSIVQIANNLIRNAQVAIQQQDSDLRHITIRVHLHSADKNRVIVQIRDTGIGIPNENLQKIFAQSCSTSGSDQGDSLHRNAIAAKNLGGSLTALSEGPGLGATFTLELPVKFLEIPS